MTDGFLIVVFKVFSWSFLKKIIFFVVLGLHCCTWAFSSCSKRGLLFGVVCELPITVASSVAEHRLWVHRL